MGNSIKYIGKHKINSLNYYFFDTNIWIFLFHPLGSYKSFQTKQYAKLLKDLLTNQCKIIISSIILSEFFNTVLRYEFNILRDKHPSTYKNFKKDFKGTKRYNSIINSLMKIVKSQILSIAKPIGDDFDKINIDDILKSLLKMDFNDNCIVELCTKNNIVLVTDDSDFKFSSKGIQIITANNKLT